MKITSATLLIIALVAPVCQAAIWSITYPRPLSDSDARAEYPVKLLALALDQTGVKYELQASERILLQQKALKKLAENREVNVVWSMTDQTREEKLLPIRIPIYKGLIGWRVFLISESQRRKFVEVRSLQQLRLLRPLQGDDWPDAKVLRANGFQVVTKEDYEFLFTSLKLSEGDFFPRSVVEIWDEMENQAKGGNLEVESRLGVRYPTAMYFFVNKRSATLARLIEDGLEKAIANGTFDDLFKQAHQEILNRSNIINRRFFELSNPQLPEATPLGRAELWYQPE